MPLPMVHLSVAKNLLDTGFDIKNKPLFYLGSISPDAIHMRKNTDRLAKTITHLSEGRKWADLSERECFDFVIDFFNINKKKIDTDFLWGYAIHVLTDMHWSKTLRNKFVERYKKDTAPIQNEKWAYYKDTDILDQLIFNECSWKDEVWRMLQSIEYFDFFDLLSAEEIKAWNERTLHWFDSGESQHKNPIRYIQQSDILNFIADCSKSVLVLFKNV